MLAYQKVSLPKPSINMSVFCFIHIHIQLISSFIAILWEFHRYLHECNRTFPAWTGTRRPCASTTICPGTRARRTEECRIFLWKMGFIIGSIGSLSIYMVYDGWLVVLTILNNISQCEGLSHILWKRKTCLKPPARWFNRDSHGTVMSYSWGDCSCYPPGHWTGCYGNPPFFIGKSSISGPYSKAMLVYWRVPGIFSQLANWYHLWNLLSTSVPKKWAISWVYRNWQLVQKAHGVRCFFAWKSWWFPVSLGHGFGVEKKTTWATHGQNTTENACKTKNQLLLGVIWSFGIKGPHIVVPWGISPARSDPGHFLCWTRGGVGDRYRTN